MKLIISKTKEELGKRSAAEAAEIINEAIRERGYARILLSTGASQFPLFDEFIKMNIDWTKVEMFHLDEYVGITDKQAISYPGRNYAHFRRSYLNRMVGVLL